MTHRKKGRRKRRGNSTPLTTIAILVVLFGWAANLIATIMITDYEPEGTVGVALMSVLGFLLAGKVATNHDDGDTVMVTDSEAMENSGEAES